MKHFAKNNYNIILVSFIFVLLFIILMYWFFGTEIGMAIRATGMNTKMARAQGINTTFMTILCLSISNALIATGGALYAQSQGSANANTGVGALVIGLSAIIIGEGIFGKRSFKNWLISVALGAVVYFMIITIAIELGMPTQYTRLMYAVIITVVLVMPLIKKLISKKVMKHARN